MELKDKLEILSDAAKYDASCSSSGSNRNNKQGGIGNAHYSGICHSFTSDGRCVSLLKISRLPHVLTATDPTGPRQAGFGRIHQTDMHCSRRFYALPYGYGIKGRYHPCQ